MIATNSPRRSRGETPVRGGSPRRLGTILCASPATHGRHGALGALGCVDVAEHDTEHAKVDERPDDSFGCIVEGRGDAYDGRDRTADTANHSRIAKKPEGRGELTEVRHAGLYVEDGEVEVAHRQRPGGLARAWHLTVHRTHRHSILLQRVDDAIQPGRGGRAASREAQGEREEAAE